MNSISDFLREFEEIFFKKCMDITYVDEKTNHAVIELPNGSRILIDFIPANLAKETDELIDKMFKEMGL